MNTNSQFLSTVKRAIAKLASENARIGAHSRRTYKESSEPLARYFDEVRRLLNVVVPDLSPRMITLLEERFPSFLTNDRRREIYRSMIIWVNPLRYLNGSARDSIARQTEAHVGDIRNMFWRWVHECTHQDECPAPELVDLYRMYQHADTAGVQMTAEASAWEKRGYAVRSALSNFRHLYEAYSSSDSLTPSIELEDAVQKAADAWIGKNDADGLPDVDPNLVPDIGFGTFAYLKQETGQNSIAA